MARKGAEHKYEELKAEIASLVKHFPHLSGRKGGLVSKAAAAEVPFPREMRAKRKRKPMSTAAKKAVSSRMKKYWAARRKATKA